MRNIQRSDLIAYIEKLSVDQAAWALLHAEKWLIKGPNQEVTFDFASIPEPGNVTRITGPVKSKRTKILTPDMHCDTCLYGIHSFCGRPLWMSRHNCNLNTSDYSLAAWLLRFLEKKVCQRLEYVVTQTVAIKRENCLFLTKSRGCQGWTESGLALNTASKVSSESFGVLDVEN